MSTARPCRRPCTPLASPDCLALLSAVHRPDVAGQAGPAFWGAVAVLWLVAAAALSGLSNLTLKSLAARRAVALLVPVLFGAWSCFLWEVVVRGVGVPFVLLPPPTAIARPHRRLRCRSCGDDFVQTFLKAVLAGYAIGCGCRLRRRDPRRPRSASCAAACCRSAISSRRCRSSASRRSW